MSALPRLSGADLANIAELLTIQDHETGVRSQWKPNAAQRRIWNENSEHRFVYVLKPRQVGASTAVCLDNAVWTATCDAAGHRVRCAIVVDTFDKAMERLWVCEDFLRQLGLKYHRADNVIRFANGSEIVAWSAGSDEVGRSLSIQRLHITELPFWEKPKDAYIALMQGLSLDGECVIETTADIKTPFARDLWREDNEFIKVFFPVTEHEEYRADPDSITDEKYREVCDRIGTVEREVAAWLAWAVANKCGGDWLKARREYPPTEADCWAASEGRWVKVTSRICTPVDVIRVPSCIAGNADIWPLMVWREPEHCSGRTCITCDSAKGTGISRATVIVIDEDDGKMVASFADPFVMGDDQARVAWEAWNRWSREITKPTGDKEWQRPRVLVEDNTVGRILIQPLQRIGLPFTIFDTDEGMKLLGMQYAKAAIENRTPLLDAGGRPVLDDKGQPVLTALLEGPKELAEECDECTRDPLTGKFKGHKDVMMSYGFWAARAKPQDRTPKKDTRIEHRIDGKALARAAMRTERMRGRGR